MSLKFLDSPINQRMRCNCGANWLGGLTPVDSCNAVNSNRRIRHAMSAYGHARVANRGAINRPVARRTSMQIIGE
jgi:hypothetical protein